MNLVSIKATAKKLADGSVRVVVQKRELELGGHEVAANISVLQTMRAAGVPAIGLISIQGVKRGTLTMETEPCFGDVVYTWRPGAEEADPAAGL